MNKPRKGTRRVRKCEFSRTVPNRHGIPKHVPCGRQAEVYGGFPGADAWAGAACMEHAERARNEGFRIWERLR